MMFAKQVPGPFTVDSRNLATNLPPVQTLAYFWVALGGALGSVARFWLSGVVARHFGETFPWGTLLVNVSGSFVIGLFATLTGPEGRWLLPPWFRQQFFIYGICGGYTTFSSFSIQTLNLASDGVWFYAAGNVFLSVASCLVAVWLGHMLALMINDTSQWSG